MSQWGNRHRAGQPTLTPRDYCLEGGDSDGQHLIVGGEKSLGLSSFVSNMVVWDLFAGCG